MTEPEPAPPAVLAFDGGNSKTDLAMVTEDGTLTALVRGPGLPTRLGAQTMVVLGDLVRQALAGRDAVAAHLVACVANADLESEERDLERMLADQGWAGSVFVANDTYAVLRAGLDDVPAGGADRHWGVGVTCGTGINCVGVAPDGRTARFLALGQISGDWGGGFDLGLAAQWHAIRAADGRGPATVLGTLVPARFGKVTPEEVAIALHQGEISPGELVGLPPVIFGAADAGDQVARDLVLRLAEEISLLASSAIRRLGLAAGKVPVVLGGGILAAGNPLLIGRVTERITAEVPAARIRVVAQAPVVGAALIGLDAFGAPVAAKQALRAGFARAPHASRGDLSLVAVPRVPRFRNGRDGNP